MEKCEMHDKMYGMVARIDERTLAIDKRINGSIDDIQKHIERGTSWRIAIVAVGIGLIVQIIGFAHMYGKLTEKVLGMERTVYANEK